MSLLKILMVVGVLGFAYHSWNEHKQAKLLAVQAQASPGGFIPAAMPNDAKPGTVLILAPLNCPSDAAQRADALAVRLDRMGIPTQRSNHFSANVTNPSEEETANLNRSASVLNGEIPAVFINGMAKANPSADEVAAEYRRAK
jgi:hypothetical protein